MSQTLVSEITRQNDGVFRGSFTVRFYNGYHMWEYRVLGNGATIHLSYNHEWVPGTIQKDGNAWRFVSTPSWGIAMDLKDDMVVKVEI